ncbi:ATP-binding protein [Flavobacterium humidisoli]|uniref:AAA family ATPase n=1 Tax=Flavobacterium humidisoli TaxID=2937442 RepID=A0ABY4LXY1_9FLAO|nr:ATP-binding protein [Flavobacterium humidisoli]UPZ17937.1 AAA family ATPase [Flavobacterium humidisoli]
MRISYVKIIDFKNLNNFEVKLDDNYMETVLLGQNASGKSNFIESLVLIFKNLDLERGSEFNYTINYNCRGKDIEIVYENNKYDFTVADQKISVTEFFRRKNELLPKYVFTYYSGISDRLKNHFDQHQKRFYDKIIKPNIDHNEIDNLRRLFYVQLVHSYFVLLAYFSFDTNEKESIDFLRNVLGIEDLESVLFILHKPIWKKGDGDERFWGANGLVKEFLQKVWDLSIAPIYETVKVPLDFRKSTKQERLYLYISSKHKLKKLSKIYKSNTEFFKALESTYISDLIEEVRVKIKKKNVKGEIKFKELSEGEQQLLTVIGLLKFSRDEESLILLDEPDTHLNPLWKWKYLEYLKDVVNTEKDATQIILNTHDPLVIGSLRKEQVRVFQNINGKIQAIKPEVDPKGLGVAGILTSEMFGLATTLDEETQEVLNRRNELIVKQDKVKLTQAESHELNNIFHELNSLGINTTDRDPLYQKFIIAINSRDDFKKIKYTSDELKEQNRIALDILDELLKEESKNDIH